MTEQCDPPLKDAQLLEFWRAETAKEQEFYWARFSAFSALHAAMIVFYATSDSTRSAILAFFGIGLAVVWIIIQCASRHYVARASEPFHELRRKIGIHYPERKSIFNCGELASTKIGLWVPPAMLLLWIVVAWPDNDRVHRIEMESGSVELEERDMASLYKSLAST